MDKYEQYPYYIHYIFNKDINKVYLALSLSWGYAKKLWMKQILIGLKQKEKIILI